MMQTRFESVLAQADPGTLQRRGGESAVFAG